MRGVHGCKQNRHPDPNIHLASTSGHLARSASSRSRLSDASERRERLEEPDRETAEITGDHRDPHEHHDPAGDNLKNAARSPHGFHPRHEAAHEEGRQNEGQAEAERIDGQEDCSASGSCVRGRQRQNRAEDRPDAWCPAKGKRKPRR